MLTAAWGTAAVGFFSVGAPPSAAATSANSSGQADDGSFESRLRGGDAAQSSGDLNSALKQYKAAIEVNPSIEAWLRLGNAELVAEDTSASLQAYTAAQNLDPENPEAAFRLGEIALAQGNVAAAVKQLEISLSKRPNDPSVSNAAAVAYTMQHKYQKAGQYYKRALAAEPNNPYWRNNYGLFEVASGDFDGALATFSSLALSREADDQYRIKVALVYLALGRMKEALASAPRLKPPELRQALSANYYIDIPEGELELTVRRTTTELRFIKTGRKTRSTPDAPQSAGGEGSENSGGHLADSPTEPLRGLDSAVAANTMSASAEADRAGNRDNSKNTYMIQVGSDRSEQEAFEDWRRLRERHADILGSLSLTITRADLGRKGIYFRIQAGPIEDGQKAARYCARLTERKVGCIIVHR